MAQSINDTNILSSILAELKELRSSQSSLESRLEALAISGSGNPGSGRGTPSAGGAGAAGGSQPIPIGQSANGVSGATPPGPGPHFGASPASPPSAAIGFGRKGSIDNGSNAAKLEYLNWTRSNSGTPASPPGTSASSSDPYAAAGSIMGDRSIYQSRAILTTYPGQVGVTPIPLKWGAATAEERGPILASRQRSSLGLRNAIGAYGGAYSIYHALSVAIGQLDPNQRPNYTHTEPTFDVKPNPSWFDPTKIVTIDPWGHLAQVEFKKQIDSGIDIRPSISITRAHLKIAELDDAVAKGRLPIDGKIVIPSAAVGLAEDIEKNSSVNLDKGAEELLNHMKAEAGVEVNVSKVAFENVWYLPGVAQRLSVSENVLRRCLFEDTGGMYPELLTRQDLKMFFPPIGGGTCYIFGPTHYLSDPSKKLAVRVHDACSGSDIFGSDICTCRPYLLHGIEEAIKCAQNGGVGLIVYFQKEGRALGEVTKYLVYNARKRGGDSASTYFARTENIAGVKDMRFQALMPDILHWLGVREIHDLYSMSDMKHDAIVNSGIKVGNRHDLPADLIPPDSQVEIQAKINAGYFSSKGTVTTEDLTKTVGRAWEDLEH